MAKARSTSANAPVELRVLLWGPRGAGTSTFLDYVVKVSTPIERTADRARFGPWPIQGFPVTLELGTTADDASGASELVGTAHAVIFVADSLPDRRAANRHAMTTLEQAAVAAGRTVTAQRSRIGRGLPLVVFYNKQDVEGAASVADLRGELNTGGFEDFAGVARTGPGVMAVVQKCLVYSLIHRE